MRPMVRRLTTIALAIALAVGARAAGAGEERIRVLTTTTDLREIAKEVGGDDVAVTCLMKGPEDPHFLDARPSFVKAAADADALVLTGMELEIGYEPLLLSESRNAKIQKGQPGYVDCSAGVAALEVPVGGVDRSLGDVHPMGNPHYLTDPVWGKNASKNISEALAVIDPPHAEAYRKRAADFQQRVDVAMWGEALVAAQKPERLEKRLADGTLVAFLKQHDLADKLGGLVAELAPFAGRKVVAYHGTMLYLLERFHLEEIGQLEPKPGIPPSPRHLAELEDRMKADAAKVVIYNAYQPERTAKAVATAVDGEAVKLAHMPDSLPGTATYIDTLTYNVKSLAQGLKATTPAEAAK
jgi:zinc/manganese transport system substrate-binding protein